jgi:predicted outer membrane repeat protein
MEALEPRIMLSVFTVNSLADDGSAGTLRYEIQAADSNATTTHNSETVVFASGLNGTITLNGNALAIDNSSGSVTIQGPGSKRITIDAAARSGVFTESATSHAEIDGLTITGGSGDVASGIYLLGVLIVNDCTITGNTSDGFGGAIYTWGGTLTVNSSTISNNTDTDSSGAAINNVGTIVINNSTITGNTSELQGGAIYNAGTMTILNSTISGNSTTGVYGGDGGAIYQNRYNTPYLTIVNSTISGNTASRNGGAIASYSQYLDIFNSTISGNSAGGRGGGVYSGTHWGAKITDSTIAGNSAVSGGGGIANNGGGSFPFTLNGSIVAGNTVNGNPGDISGSLTGSYDLIGDGSGGSLMTHELHGSHT